MLKAARNQLVINGIAFALLIGTGATSAGAQQQETYNYHSLTGEIVARGTQALKLCNGIFTSGRTIDQVYAQELDGMGEMVPQSRVTVDQRVKAVAVGVGGNDHVPAMRSAFREGFGCVVMAPDQSFDDIDKLPILKTPPLPGDAATIPWPNGDRVEKKALPSNVSAAALDAAGNWALDRVAHGGHQGQVTLSLLVVHRGDIVYERYAPGFSMNTRTRTWSTAKSITSTLVGIAVARGLLALDKPLPFAWLPDEEQTAPDPRKKITLRNVLNMSTGLYPVDDEYEEAIGSHLSYFGGWNASYHARDRGMISEPGTVFNYENYDTLLGVLALRAVLGDEKTYHEFPRSALFDKIGMRNTMPGVDRFGNYILSSQVYTNARDLARLGLLYLNRGKWGSEQILPESWVDFVRTPAPTTRATGNQYGGHWWLVPDNRTDLPQDAYSTSGARGQFTIVVPSYDLVIVRRGLDWRQGGRGLSQWDLLAEVIKAFPGRQGGLKQGAAARVP
ncbi:MAG: serine hydrolase domain-containing protein [Longimicrobiales bacterium]